MSDKNFIEKLTQAIERNNSLLCVGLDPDPRKFPDHFPTPIDTAGLVAWGQSLIEQTADLVCCYKPNFAFYEQYGPTGLEALRQTIAAVPADIPVLLDAKRGDIGSTAAAYARAAFEVWQADAITVSPYLGRDSIVPFLTYPGRMVFVLCYTSNPSAADIQELVFEHIARRGTQWGDETQVGFVIGATQPHALARFRRLTAGQRPRWILAPGTGTQGGDLQATLQAGLDDQGNGLIIPVSRSVTYAASPRQAAVSLRQIINRARHISQTGPETGIKPASAYADLIVQLHAAGCIQFGDFTLASGQSSPLYIDLRRLTARPLLLKQAAGAYANLLNTLTFDHLAAVPYAALTIGTAVALVVNRSLIYPRKESKTYGTGKTVEGVFSTGDTAVIIEDVVTSGGSVLKAAAALKAAGLQATDVVVLIDREQGGRDKLAGAGYRLQAVLQLSEILETLYRAGLISAEQVTAVKRGQLS